MSKINDIAERSFGRLTADRFVGILKRRAMWECSCSCGGMKIVSCSDLVTGKTKSCGCLSLENSLKNIKGVTKPPIHGGYGSLTYVSWAEMKKRCTNQKCRQWPYYGGRGISFDPAWDKYENFLRDMGERPSRLYTLDRKENDGNYTLDNCQWSTKKEQANNRRIRKDARRIAA